MSTAEKLGGVSTARRRAARYERWSFHLDPETEDYHTYCLWQQGTLGIETRKMADGESVADAYFIDKGEEERARLGEALGELGLQPFAVEGLADEDWLAPFRAAATIFELGRGFLVDPGEPEEAIRRQDTLRSLLSIPARQAFGTGSHESTRLAVEMLEGLDLRGRRLLDFGAGSGILSFCALKLGAEAALGVEHDLVAVLAAGENRRLNRLYPALLAGTLASLARARTFEVIVANILPRFLIPELPRLRSYLARGGRVLLSGFLQRQRQEVEQAAVDLQLRVRSRHDLDGWAALHLEDLRS